MQYKGVKIHGVTDAEELDEIMDILDETPDAETAGLTQEEAEALYIQPSRKWPAESE